MAVQCTKKGHLAYRSTYTGECVTLVDKSRWHNLCGYLRWNSWNCLYKITIWIMYSICLGAGDGYLYWSLEAAVGISPFCLIGSIYIYNFISLAQIRQHVVSVSIIHHTSVSSHPFVTCYAKQWQAVRDVYVCVSYYRRISSNSSSLVFCFSAQCRYIYTALCFALFAVVISQFFVYSGALFIMLIKESGKWNMIAFVPVKQRMFTWTGQSYDYPNAS